MNYSLDFMDTINCSFHVIEFALISVTYKSNKLNQSSYMENQDVMIKGERECRECVSEYMYPSSIIRKKRLLIMYRNK